MSRLPLLIVALSLASLTGCVKRHQTDVAELADKPVSYDEAMLLRDWSVTQASYGDAATVAGPTYFEYEYAGFGNEGRARSAAAPAASRLGDPAVFVGNVLMLPIRMVQTPPWSTVEYQPVIVPPSYHAAPPLRGDDTGATVAERGRDVDASDSAAPGLNDGDLLDRNDGDLMTPTTPTTPTTPEGGATPAFPRG